MSRNRKSRRKNTEDLLVHPWTHEEDAFLIQHYPKRGPQWCAEAMQAIGYERTRSSVDNRGFKLGLVYLGPKLGCFKKGQVPANKGKKMAPEVYAKAAPNMFKKGNRSGAANQKYKPIGHETFRRGEYWWVKIAEGRWELKHRIIWERHHGPIPPAHMVIFRDGNPHNFSLNNLELITRGEHARRNRHGAGPSQYSLLSGRAARARLNKQGIGDRAIRANPELLKLAQAENILSLAKRKRK